MNPLETIESLLGADAFLVPCIRGTKMPAVTYTQRPFEATQTPAYRFALASGEFNIAVYLGKMSGGLCALDFDQDEDLAAFLAVNPALAATTRSRGSRGGMVWLRDRAGEFPRRVAPRNILSGGRTGGFRRFSGGIRRAWITPCWWMRRRWR